MKLQTGYTPGFCVYWGVKRSHWHYMNAALALARRMRARGHTVIVVRR